MLVIIVKGVLTALTFWHAEHVIEDANSGKVVGSQAISMLLIAGVFIFWLWY